MEKLDDIKAIKAVDASDMLTLLSEFSSQCKHAVALAHNFKISSIYQTFSNIVFCGLGGSAISGDVIKSYLIGEIGIPLVINRNYTLPNFVSRESLVFVLSYSGNTEETISAYYQARERKAKIIVISSGGRLAAKAKEEGVAFITIPSNLPPRAAFGYLFFPPLILLCKLKVIRNKQAQIKETIETLDNLRESQLKVEIKSKNNLAKKLAQDIFGRFPVIYASSDHLEGVVMRWRGQLAENSKNLSSSHFFPEMNHNEIIGWENPHRVLNKFLVILLRDKDDYLRTKRRIDITKSIIKLQNIPIREVCSQGKGLLSRILSLIYIGDFVSFYLAVLNDVDPTPVEKIEYLKRQLSRE